MTPARLSASLVAPLLLGIGLAAPARAENGSLGEPKMLIHGNYCGPGNNAPLPPIDALDAACARHDACTPNGGLPTPACNLRLQREAETIARDPRQPDDLRALAGIVAATAPLIPSEPRAAPGTDATGALRAPTPRRSAPPAGPGADDGPDGGQDGGQDAGPGAD